MSDPVAPLVVRSAEAPAPPLVVQMEDGTELKYQLVNASVEQLCKAQTAYVALTEEEKAGDVRAWVDVLATFMRRDDAARFVKEQTVGTLRLVVTAALERVRKQVEAKPAS